MSKTLYLMLGYPGAGKTTTAKQIAKITGAVHLSSDKFREQMFPKAKFTNEEHKQIYDALDQKTEELLRGGKSVIYDANLNRYVHRQQKYDICKKTSAKPLLLWVQTATPLAKERAIHESRHHLVPPNEPPDKMFDRIAGIFEPPHDNEQYLSVDGTKVSETYIKDLLDEAA